MTALALMAIKVDEYTEKKNGLTYLSWARAWAEVLKVDDKAWWEIQEYHMPTPDGVRVVPYMTMEDNTAMVKVTVWINENKRSCILPVMNHKNQAIETPSAFQVNTAIMRCLAKAIAMHGLGLSIYAGEDLVDDDTPTKPPKPTPKAPASTEGRPGRFQISVKSDGDPQAFFDIVTDATTTVLNLAKNQQDVMEIFKVNRAIFDKVKEMDDGIYKVLMSKFTEANNAFKKEAQ